jgi:hypothetical protein
LALAVTSAVAIIVVYLQSQRSFRIILQQRKLDSLRLSLHEFYDPLLVLLDLNNEIFSRTGPNSFPVDNIQREAAVAIWSESRNKILENNNSIEDILRNKSHLIHKNDSFQNYKGLFAHIAMYQIFQKIKTDSYKYFMFPSEIRDHVEQQRVRVLNDIHVLEGDVK